MTLSDSSSGLLDPMLFTGFHFLGHVSVCLVPFKTHDFKGFGPDFDEMPTGLQPDLNCIPWHLVKHHLTAFTEAPMTHPSPKCSRVQIANRKSLAI